MTEKEMRRLNRAELLQLLLVQTTEAELLLQKLEDAEKRLAQRQIELEKAGDIAQAALQINGVMEAAQAAARQYLENIERMELDTRQRCEKALREAQLEAERIVRNAKKEAAMYTPAKPPAKAYRKRKR